MFVKGSQWWIFPHWLAHSGGWHVIPFSWFQSILFVSEIQGLWTRNHVSNSCNNLLNDLIFGICPVASAGQHVLMSAIQNNKKTQIVLYNVLCQCHHQAQCLYDNLHSTIQIIEQIILVLIFWIYSGHFNVTVTFKVHISPHSPDQGKLIAYNLQLITQMEFKTNYFYAILIWTITSYILSNMI